MSSLAELVEPLRRLHDWLRGIVLDACEQVPADELTKVVHEGDDDTTYGIDRICETALVDWLTHKIAVHEPIVLICEGISGGQIVLPQRASAADAQWRIIVDPIDGTRGLMYQKRPGWILTGVAPNRDEATTLADIALAVQTEIPLIKQHLCDQAWAVRGQGTNGKRINRLTGQSKPLVIQPSSASSVRDGFATICRFFPGGRDILAAIDDELCDRLLRTRKSGEAAVFDDQYASTGGQLFGLATGQDRFVADLRPIVRPIVESRGQVAGHCCHPYDMCTKLIAEEVGVVITSPFGGALNSPLDTTTEVGWVGYANRNLQAGIEPALQQILRRHLRARQV